MAHSGPGSLNPMLNNPAQPDPLDPVAQQKRMNEIAENKKQYERYAQAYAERMNIKRSEFKALLLFDKLDEQRRQEKILYDEQNDNAKNNGNGTIQAITSDKDLYGSAGIWQFNDELIYRDEDGRSRPIPCKPGIYNKAGYSAVIDNLALDGATTLTFHFPKPEDGRLSDFNKMQLDKFMKQLLQKGLAIDLTEPDSMKAYLKKLGDDDPAALKRVLARSDVLLRNKIRNEILMMDEKIKKEDLVKDTKSIEDATAKDGNVNFVDVNGLPDVNAIQAYKDRIYDEYEVVGNPQPADLSANIDKKLEAIEAKLKDIAERRDNLDKITNDLNADLKVMNNVIDNPNALARTKFPKEGWQKFKHDLAKTLGIYDTDKIKQKYSDKEELLTRLEELRKNEPEITKQIDAVDKERVQLSKLEKVWKDELGVLKQDLETQKQNQPQQATAKEKKTLETQLNKTNASLNKIDAGQSQHNEITTKVQDIDKNNKGMDKKIKDKKADVQQAKTMEFSKAKIS